ncbi:uncharacterized protein F5147DRAFT_332721 [Suillus discolor]|uniref:Uncharacterized protein n=1 Tax=Suillus discolor TaxID=1912936 RepID=A0A9P7F1I5_9AGAM|nr:uncharacterized protein F5147DRAFT_332721 [Suillus discolor]KAG2099861.1 hypothetical protein F5147DRAFT_332721 [Suillus discolor]
MPALFGLPSFHCFCALFQLHIIPWIVSVFCTTSSYSLKQYDMNRSRTISNRSQGMQGSATLCRNSLNNSRTMTHNMDSFCIVYSSGFLVEIV